MSINEILVFTCAAVIITSGFCLALMANAKIQDIRQRKSFAKMRKEADKNR